MAIEMEELEPLLREEYAGLSKERLRGLFVAGSSPTRIIEIVAGEYPHASHGSIQWLFMAVFGISFKDSIVATYWIADDHFGITEQDANARLLRAISERRSTRELG